jgi:nicotinamidase-related amidase
MKSALLVIDVQRALFGEEPRPFEADAVIGRINALAARARDAGAPVIFIQHEEPNSSLQFQAVGWQLDPHLDAESGDHFVRKATSDSFLETGLGALLGALRVSHVVVCGYASEFCVDTTVRRAAALGFRVTLASDAHSTHEKAHASAASIRLHENSTLPCITSFGAAIEAVPGGEVRYAV